MKNVDDKVVKAFGEEWDYYNQSLLKEEESKDLFSRYFNIFPINFLQDDGCGSNWYRVFQWGSFLDSIGL